MPRVARIAAEVRKSGVPVRDMEMLDALLHLVEDHPEAAAQIIYWLRGDPAVRAGELTEPTS